MLLFWGVIVGIGVLIYRALSNPPNRTTSPPRHRRERPSNCWPSGSPEARSTRTNITDA
jgi:hypothetical protein